MNHPYPTANHLYPTAATSSATLNSILTTTASPRTQHQPPLPTIPAKRKIRDVSPTPAYDSYTPVLHPPLAHPVLSPSPALPAHSPSAQRRRRNSTTTTTTTSTTPTPLPEPPDVSSEAVDCICGFAVDDGFSIACDVCSRWCHSACFGIAQGGPVPESFLCWVCRPRSVDERDAAVRLQRERLLGAVGSVGYGEGGLGLTLGDEVGKQRRRLSPGTDRRARKGPAASTIDGNGPAKRRRRPSVLHPPPTPTLPASTNAPPPPPAPQPPDEEHIDIDAEPWTSTYVPITHDLVHDDDTRTKLRRHAQHWRGITAISTSPPPLAIRPLPPSPTPLLSSVNPHCRPPAYAAYTTRALRSASLITPYVSCVTPASAYLREPTNGYAHLGMPKPYVHLVGPPLGVALDARGVGGEGRFVRWGCRPNAELRPVLCREGREKATKAGVRYERRAGQKDEGWKEEKEDGREKEDDDETTLGFAVFALRDLKAGEEVVLGWEWDDGHAVHRLPALLRAPHMFPRTSSDDTSRTPHMFSRGSSDTNASPGALAHLRNQLASILHALSSTFTTCACGARARDCALSAMEAVVARLEAAGEEGRAVSSSSSSHNPSLPPHDPGAWTWARAPEDEVRQERGGRWNDVDLGPLVGRKRGFRTRERVPYSGGMGGMELVDDEDGEGSAEGRMDKEGLGRGGGVGKRRRDGMRVNGRHVLAGKSAVEMETGKEQQERFTFSVVPPGGGDGDAMYVRQSRSGKGKARAMDGDEDVEMDCIGGRSTALPPSTTASLHPDSTPVTRASPVPTSHTQPIREPRPPDPPPAPPAPHDEDRMPPKMRKRWMHRAVQARLHAEVAELQAVVMGGKDFDGREVEARKGLGIRFDEGPDPTPPTNAQHLMPPPPMPAALDPTTISSQRAQSTTPTPSPPSPHLLTPSSTHLSLSPRILHPDIHATHNKHPYQLNAELCGHSTGTSPLNGFANLSLMSPALMLVGEDKGRLEEPKGAPSPSPPPSSATADVGQQELGHGSGVDGGARVDEDVEMGATGDVHEQMEASEEQVVDGVGKELSVPWSPLRRADKTDVLPAVEIRVDVQDPEPIMEQESTPMPIATEEEGAIEVQQELSEEKSPPSPSPLDSMASTPPARLSPSPAPIVFVRDASPTEHGEKQEDERKVEDTSAPLLRAPSLEPEAHVAPADIPDPSPSPSPRPSLGPIHTTNAVDDAHIPNTQPPTIVKSLPPDHFFDTDDEEEWKRQMDVDEPSTTHVPRSPTPSAHDDEDEDMEETPRRASISREMRTAELASSESEDDVDESPEQPLVHRKRRSSIDSSRSASVTLDVETAAVDVEVDEPPPSTGSTVGAFEAPPLSAESASSTVDLTTEQRPPSPDPTPSLALDTSPSNPPAKSASPSPTHSMPSPAAPHHQLSPTPAHEGPAHDHAAQPKVKLSLRDFVLRKKKQREEQEATKSAQASPMSVTSALAPEDGEGERGTTPAPAARSAITPLATSDASRNAPSATSPTDIRMTALPTQSPAVGTPTPLADAGVNGGGAKRSEVHDFISAMTDAGWHSTIEKLGMGQPKTTPASHGGPTHEKLQSAIVTTPADALKPGMIYHDGLPIPGLLPSDVVDLTLAKLEAREPILNGYHRLPTKVSSPSTQPLPSKPPFLLPARPQPTSFASPPVGTETREAKKELLDPPISHLSASGPVVVKPAPPSNVPSQTTIPRRLYVPVERPISPISPDANHGVHSRRPSSSQEDGEIEASPPSAPHRPLASSVRPFPPKSRLFTSTNFVSPQAHSPPTGPRSSFLPSSGSPTPTFNGGGSTYRPAATTHLAAASTNAATNRPAPPSAPRALRQSMLSNKPASTLPNNSSSSSSYGASQYIPRGPSADRDRDRDRDWDSRHYRGQRRGGGTGWTR